MLVAIVDAYAAQEPGDRRRLYHVRDFGGQALDGIPDLGVTEDDLDELQTSGFVDIDYATGGDYMVKPTPEGREEIRRYRREVERQKRAEAVDLSWIVVRPVLHAAVDIWTESGASVAGYVSLRALAEKLERKPSDLGLIRAVELLGAENWLDVEYAEDDDDPMLKPRTRAIVATRAWPGGDGEVAAERLLAVLDDIAANATDEGKRKWAARLRDTAMEVTTKTLAEVASKMAGEAI